MELNEPKGRLEGELGKTQTRYYINKCACVTLQSNTKGNK